MKVHIDKNTVSKPYKTTGVQISIDLGKLAKSRIYHMLSKELGFVFVESVRYKYSEIIHPAISRCGG